MKENVAVALVRFVGVEEEADVSVMLAEVKMEKLASRVGEESFPIVVRNALMRSKADLLGSCYDCISASDFPYAPAQRRRC